MLLAAYLNNHRLQWAETAAVRQVCQEQVLILNNKRMYLRILGLSEVHHLIKLLKQLK